MTPVLKFPTLVYKTPGSHSCDGATFDYLPVQNEDQLEAAIKRGYYLSLPEAIDGMHDMDKIDNLVIEDPVDVARIPHVADPVIQQFDNIQLEPQVNANVDNHPLDKSGGSPDDLEGLRKPDVLDGADQRDPDDEDNASVINGMTRDELEARANELGIDYDGRNSNKTLARLIAEREAQDL